MKNDIVPILDMVKTVGEDAVKEILSDFSCEYADGQRNGEVERFIQNNAIEFSKRKMSITYLVMNERSKPVGYFTLTHKPVIVCDNILKSNANRKRMQRYAKFDPQSGTYNLSAFLIAQFSKNYGMPTDERISGTDLMGLVLSRIESIQQQIGGGVVFLESENQQALLDFYTGEPNSFFAFGERCSETDGTKYVQLMRFL